MSAVATRPENGLGEILEQVIVRGNLADLKPEERTAYYLRVCESLGLNPWTRPLEYITLSGKLVLYARKDCTEQLRERKGVSIVRLEREISEGIYVVTAHATNKNGREDSAIGAVNIEGLKGEAKANAFMKAETKSKRRVTLSICGLGVLDESEVESIPDAKPHHEPPPAIPAAVPAKKAITRDQFAALGEALTRLKWHRNHTVNWLREHYQCERLTELTAIQAGQALELLAERLEEMEAERQPGDEPAEETGDE